MTEYERGYRDALEAAAQRVESRDEERQALARVIRSLSPPPERGAATAATCKTCGGTKVVLYCRCGCGLTADAAAREAMDGPAALNREQAEANIPTEERPCPDCTAPQQAATGTGGDAIEAPGDGYPATNGDMRPPADAKAATCATCNDTGSVETEPCPYIDHSWHRRPR